MPFLVVQPPDNDEKFAEVGKELFHAAAKLGIELDLQGFLNAWVRGTRVVIERTADGDITSMAFLAIGKRWQDNTFKASLLEIRGNIDVMMDFIKQICAALGVSHLIYELLPTRPSADGNTIFHTVTEEKL